MTRKFGVAHDGTNCLAANVTNPGGGRLVLLDAKVFQPGEVHVAHTAVKNDLHSVVHCGELAHLVHAGEDFQGRPTRRHG